MKEYKELKKAIKKRLVNLEKEQYTEQRREQEHLMMDEKNELRDIIIG